MIRAAALAACRTLPRLALALGAVAGLSATASACPSCSLSQGSDTLLYILLFLFVPYAVVSGVVLWIRHLLRSEGP